MMTRLSPGSPSQMMAALFPLPSSTCLSTQFSQTLSLAPLNHFAFGAFHCRTESHFFCHFRSLASRAQKVFGFSMDSLYILLY